RSHLGQVLLRGSDVSHDLVALTGTLKCSVVNARTDGTVIDAVDRGLRGPQLSQVLIHSAYSRVSVSVQRDVARNLADSVSQIIERTRVATYLGSVVAQLTQLRLELTLEVRNLALQLLLAQPRVGKFP